MWRPHVRVSLGGLQEGRGSSSYVRGMTASTQVSGSGHARYTFRLRVSSTARRLLLAEWDRCRWVWNECVARSKKAQRNGEKCGPASLDRMLTGARAMTPWLSEGASVPQQQTIRDFATSRAKALKDIRERLPVRRRAGMPRHRKKHGANLTLNYTKRGFRLTDGRLNLAGGVVGDSGVVAASACRPLQCPRVPRQHRALVRLFRRSRSCAATRGNWCGDRCRLGSTRDRHHDE